MLTIRNLDDDLKHRLKERAAAHGRSMEAEARQILGDALRDGSSHRTGQVGLGTAIRQIFAKYGIDEVDDLEFPSRSASPRAAEFE